MANKFAFSDNEQRVIGCLIEKEITTPEHYPLSLNALTNACNQKSNRDPVMNLTESEVQDTLSLLKEKRLISVETGFGSRVAKYRHRFCNTEFGDFKLTEQELGLLCVLLLRGPQTPGELRTRSNRLCDFSAVSEVEEVLTSLQKHDTGALVSKLPREPGKRESRYLHLLGDSAEDADTDSAGAGNVGSMSTYDNTANTAASNAGTDSDKSAPDNAMAIAALERRVAALEEQLAKVLAELDAKAENLSR